MPVAIGLPLDVATPVGVAAVAGDIGEAVSVIVLVGVTRTRGVIVEGAIRVTLIVRVVSGTPKAVLVGAAIILGGTRLPPLVGAGLIPAAPVPQLVKASVPRTSKMGSAFRRIFSASYCQRL